MRSTSAQVAGADSPATVPGLTRQVFPLASFATYSTEARCEWLQHTRSHSPDAPAQAPSTAFAAQFAGLLAERWYFFAEAKHPQNL